MDAERPHIAMTKGKHDEFEITDDALKSILSSDLHFCRIDRSHRYFCR